MHICLHFSPTEADVNKPIANTRIRRKAKNSRFDRTIDAY